MASLATFLLAACLIASTVSVDLEVDDDVSSVVTTQAPNQTPDYKRALDNFNKAVKVVSKLGNVKSSASPNSPKRHYALLLGVLVKLNDKLSGSCGRTYEDQYMKVVQEMVPKAWSHPEKYLTKLQDTISKVQKQVKKVKKVVKSTKKGQNLSSLDEDTKKVLKVVEVLGELSETYLNNTYEDDAKNYTTVRLLVNGQDELKDLVEKSVELRKLLDGNERSEKDDKC